MGDDAVVVGQGVAGPTRDDRFLARVADRRRGVAVLLARVVVGRGNAGAEERHRNGRRTERGGGVDPELLHATLRVMCLWLCLAETGRVVHRTIRSTAGSTLGRTMAVAANPGVPSTGLTDLDFGVCSVVGGGAKFRAMSRNLRVDDALFWTI